MARQDYILNALNDVKAHLEKIDSKIDQVQEKGHKLELVQERMSKTLEVNTEDVQEHMSRTKAAEQRLDIVEEALSKIHSRVESQEKLQETISGHLVKIAGWIGNQQEKANARKELVEQFFVWVKRAGIVLAIISALYGGYEGWLKLLEYL